MTTAEKKGTGGSPKGKPNRLIGETSPYLLQHAHNPVDWYPWGQEALDKARRQDKPILLSIGYSACHWCHVMEHESFESDEIAAIMNEYFVPIKVDREERPDLDEIYMKAVQLMTGHGGWPMTVFLTPDLKPFFGGTYYPPEDRHGMPGFKRLLLVMAQTWREQRDKLDASSTELTNYMSLLGQVEKADSVPDFSVIERSLDRITQAFDRTWGGFGGAPKFPQAYTLALALRCAAPTSEISGSRRQECSEVVRTTLDRMAYGGMHDQIGGGFARYSVDRYWRVPHFEKMLYDNATLSKIYLEGYQLFGRNYWLNVAAGTLDFVIRELATEDGALYSSLDADSQGEEGKFYVWRPEEILEILGQEEGSWFNAVYGVSKIGSFEHGTSVLTLSGSPESLAEKYGISEEQFWQKLLPLRETLLKARERRIRPGRDEKVLTAWNSLMISSFVTGYQVLSEERYLKAAKDAANFILTNLYANGRLLRTWGKGQSKLNAYLDDYAYTIKALIDLSSIDTSNTWLAHAVELTDFMIEHFWDEDEGGFFYTTDDHEQLITRTKNFYDGSTPSGTSVATVACLQLAVITGNESYRHKAETVLSLYGQHAEKSPDQFANLLCALDSILAEPSEIVLVSKANSPEFRKMLSTINQFYLPNTIKLVKEPAGDKKVSGKQKTAKIDQVFPSPLFASRETVDGKPTVYVCRNHACEEPITSSAKLKESLRRLAGWTSST